MRKVIVAGGRDFTDDDRVREVLFQFITVGDTEIVSGGARGADKLGEVFAVRWKLPLKVFPAKWDEHGKAAGPIRNRKMAEYADVLVVFWDGQSRGTKNMIQTALEYGLEVHIYRY